MLSVLLPASNISDKERVESVPDTPAGQLGQLPLLVLPVERVPQLQPGAGRGSGQQRDQVYTCPWSLGMSRLGRLWSAEAEAGGQGLPREARDWGLGRETAGRVGGGGSCEVFRITSRYLAKLVQALTMVLLVLTRASLYSGRRPSSSLKMHGRSSPWGTRSSGTSGTPKIVWRETLEQRVARR